MAWRVKRSHLDARVAAIEVHLEHAATKEWVLTCVLGGLAVAAGIALAVVPFIV